MKIEFNNINSKKYTIKIHNLNITKESNHYFSYLFVLDYSKFTKRYIINIDTNAFKKFIYECLSIDNLIKDQTEYDINIIQLIEKYKIFPNNNSTRLYIGKKIGSLILHNIQYKNTNILKKLEKYFVTPNSALNIKDESLNCQIHYLIILINNYIRINIENDNTKLIKPTPNFAILDFIFDYYID